LKTWAPTRGANTPERLILRERSGFFKGEGAGTPNEIAFHSNHLPLPGIGLPKQILSMKRRLLSVKSIRSSVKSNSAGVLFSVS
jgi:hypothetical protein